MSGLIGISTAEQGRFAAFYPTVFGLRCPPGTVMMSAIGSTISKNRNDITQKALDMAADWVLFLDDDHVLPPATLTKLLAADKPIVSALYTQRQAPFNPVLMDYERPDGQFLWKQLNPTEKGLIEVAAAGAGCLLVRREVFEALQPPYWTLGQINPASWGDDLHFCSRVRAAGFPIYCDLSTPIGHIMTGVVYPTFDPVRGWLANFTQEPQRPPLAQWPMQIPGEEF